MCHLKDQILQKNETTWMVPSEIDQSLRYRVELVNSECSCQLCCSTCKVCIHTYSCTCMNATMHVASFPGLRRKGRPGTHCTGVCAHAYISPDSGESGYLSKSTSVYYSYSSVSVCVGQPFSAVDPPLGTSYCKVYKCIERSLHQQPQGSL